MKPVGVCGCKKDFSWNNEDLKCDPISSNGDLIYYVIIVAIFPIVLFVIFFGLSMALCCHYMNKSDDHIIINPPKNNHHTLYPNLVAQVVPQNNLAYAIKNPMVPLATMVPLAPLTPRERPVSSPPNYYEALMKMPNTPLVLQCENSDEL